METGERTLFDEALGRLSAAIEAHRDEPGWRDIVERTAGNRGSTTYVATVEAPDTEAVSYLIRVCRGRFEVIARVRRDPRADWRVSADELRHLCDRGAVELPALPLAWLARRLGIEQALRSA